MKEVKRERTGEIIHRLAAEFTRNKASEASLLTITRVELSKDGKGADIYFTTLPEDREDTALKFLTRKTPEFRQYAKAKSRLGLIPRMTFKIDRGERHRQRLDTLDIA